MKTRPPIYWRWKEGMRLLSNSSLSLQAQQLEVLAILMEAKFLCRQIMECK